MRVVLHPIRIPESRNFELIEKPIVEVHFSRSNKPFELSYQFEEWDLPLVEEADRLSAKVLFKDRWFHFSLLGAKDQDEFNVRLESRSLLHAWLHHAELKPQRCKAKCEDSGIEGYPCVECTKGDLIVRVCC